MPSAGNPVDERRSGTDDAKRPTQMHIHHRIPFCNAHIKEHAVAQNASHMHHNVDLAKILQGCLDNSLTTLRSRHGVIVCDRAATSVLNLFDDAIRG